MGWGRPNLAHSAEEKMSEAILNDGMTGHAKNQPPKPGPT